MDIPVQFRTRRPPRKELMSKMFTLLLFAVFCAMVGIRVGPMPMPSPRHVRENHETTHNDDVEVFAFSTLSPAERAQLAELSARLSVPYMSPWGKDERPALFFMWHMLYRSIKPDLEHFAADLRNTTTTENAVTATAVPHDTNPADGEGTLAPAPQASKLQIMIHVLETERGYITASLTRYLPEALVFSVVVNGSTARRRYVPREHLDPFYYGKDKERESIAADAHSPELQAYAEAVAAKVERVLTDPARENVTEATQRPGMHRLADDGDVTTTTTTTTTTALPTPLPGGEEGPAATPETEETATTAHPVASSPRLFLCVPQTAFNGSYYTAAPTSTLSANYQVLLAPYVALRSARSPEEFDATLRAIATRANVATFLALPVIDRRELEETEGGDDAAAAAADADAGGVAGEDREAQRRRFRLYAKELADFNRWYGSDVRDPAVVLRRALLVPEVQRAYRVTILPLGLKRWYGAYRELFRVELNPQVPDGARDGAAAAEATMSTTTTTTTTTSTTAAPAVEENEAAVGTTAAPPLTTTPAFLFGCSTRRSVLQCAARPRHARCEQFSDSVVAA